MNEHLIDQLRASGADLPAERIEQLEAVLICALEANEAHQTWRQFGDDWEAAFNCAHTAEDIEQRPHLEQKAKAGPGTLISMYRDQWEGVKQHLMQLCQEAEIKYYPSRERPIELIPRIWAATGDYKWWHWRASIDKAGLISVDKRDRPFFEGRMMFNADAFGTIAEFGAAFQQMTASIASSNLWATRLASAMDNEILLGDPRYRGRDTGTLRPSLRVTQRFDGSLTPAHLDNLYHDLDLGLGGMTFNSGTVDFASLDVFARPKDIYHHKAFAVGDRAAPLPLEDMGQPPTMPAGVRAEPIRSGTAYIGRNGKIICIDYD